MPPVRTLTKPGRETVTVKPGDAGDVPAELIEAPKQQGGAVALPSWAQAAPALPELPGGGSAVYVGQLQPNTGKRQTLLASGVADGEFYLDNAGQVIPLKNFRFWLVKAAAFKTEMNASGEIVAATRDLDARAKGLEEHAVALVLVDTPAGVIPAKVDFRKAQAPAFKAAADGVKMASDPAFPKISDAARVAAQFPIPWGRVVTAVTVERKISKTSGKPYFRADGSVTPSTVTDMEKLLKALQDDGFAALVDAAEKSYDFRVKQIEKVCGG